MEEIDMSELKVPLTHPKPDCDAFLKSVLTDHEPDRPRMVEYLVNAPVMKAVIQMLGRQWADPGQDIDSKTVYWDNFIAFWYHLGYDFVRLELAMNFPRPSRPGGDSGRVYAETAAGAITSWEEFEKYTWPKPLEADFFPYEHISENLPDGMGLIVCHGGGIYEHLSFIMGYETLCMALFDQPDLVMAVSQRIGELMTAYYERLLQLDRLIAIFPGDDMGFRSATMISPAHLKQYILPWHRKFASMAHEAGLPYFLHSCGNLGEIMPDLIDDVKIDARHSFEDAIMPMAEFKKRWGDQIAVLGGVDIDKLTRLSPEQLRVYVRKIIEDCAPGGRFAIGSGNSIPDYVPVENYLTMLDEALK
jgi:uroporphyrinogen decarboxylase